MDVVQITENADARAHLLACPHDTGRRVPAVTALTAAPHEPDDAEGRRARPAREPDRCRVSGEIGKEKEGP